MTTRLRPALRLTNLESRLTPAASLRFIGGNLNIFGDNTANTVDVQLTAANQAKVTVNAKMMGTYSLSGDLNVRLGNSADKLTVDLNGFTVPGSLTVTTTGNSGDTVEVKTAGAGGIAGRTTINLGNGADAITISNTAAGTLAMGSGLYVTGGNGSNTLTTVSTAANKVTISNNVVLTGLSGVTLAEGTQTSNLIVNNGNYNVASTVSLDGKVATTVTVTGGFQADTLKIGTGGDAVVGSNVVFSAGEGANVLTLGSATNTSTINGGLTYVGGNGGNTVTFEDSLLFGGASLVFGNGTNTYTFGTTATVSGDFSVTAGNGNDSIALSAGTTISGNIWLNLGNGDNEFDTNTAVINSGSMWYTGGSGVDKVSIEAAYSFNLNAQLGAGADSVSFAALTSVGSMYLDFGSDFDDDVLDAMPVITWNTVILNLP